MNDEVIDLHCLTKKITRQNAEYPLFVGFCAASQLARICGVPSFKDQTQHYEIANDVLSKPVEKWQRPLDAGRVKAIKETFSQTDEIMPNPVLLCANFIDAADIKVEPVLTGGSGGITTGVWNVVVPVPDNSSEFPLWILDGQHRIKGLGLSQQRDSPVPFVLLLDHGTNSFSAPMMAKIFAEVTTEARSLDELHQEWLTYSFELGEYHPSKPNAEARGAALQVAALLCQNTTINGTQNPFHNKVWFNHMKPFPSSQAFRFNVKELTTVVQKHYFAVTVTGPQHLTPSQVANEIGSAVTALKQVVSAPQDESVFFGQATHGHRIMQEAFLAAVLSHLSKHGPCGDWVTLLDQLTFRTSDWVFEDWVSSLSGPANALSKSVAIRILSDVFVKRAVPQDLGTLSDWNSPKPVDT